MGFALLTVVFFIVVAFLLFFGAFVIVQQSHCALITRLGSYSQTLKPGLHVIVPFIDRVDRVVDLREQVLPLASQSVITKDNVNIRVDAVVYYQIVDPYSAIYEISNLLFAIEQLALTSLRNIVGELALDETLTSRDMINTKLQQVIDSAASKWGVKTNRLELKDIDPPAEIQRAMNLQMEAERSRRATILQAEGERESAILKAEGDKQSVIKRAEGHAQKLKLEVEAQAATTRIYIEELKAAGINKDILQVIYMDTLQKLAQGPANKIFIPVESMSALGGLAAAGEAFNKN
ncbi:MAG: SPFH/Band 7/PHB domain protein [Candidatus Caenarcaniphilales bacterium]|jgi:regulator of protease activity HflC (stomatin/prohibitin superfamily)|nr:SPFH/Band 7/PHB domain protein [Candidatus Caenarcaniphilales bacterium]